ncbi:hypothetical protein K440DRAFT_251280 [Wilcoxina mikolae CBS 423.85]|nr:hypothetical protein K440DRAFT_251280 [Wilcoxina mikolae CBS 423.85]
MREHSGNGVVSVYTCFHSRFCWHSSHGLVQWIVDALPSPMARTGSLRFLPLEFRRRFFSTRSRVAASRRKNCPVNLLMNWVHGLAGSEALGVFYFLWGGIW